MKTWLITGANRGLGLEIAKAALSSGDRVVATSRDPLGLEQTLAAAQGRVAVTALDVTDRQSIDAAVEEALKRFGGIDVLVNNAGYGQLGPFDSFPSERSSANSRPTSLAPSP